MQSHPHYRVHQFEFGQACSGDVARGASARLLENRVERTLIQQLVHYGDKSPLPGFAPVKFLGSRQGFKLLAFGGPAIDLVRNIAPELAMAWSDRTGQVVRQRAWNGECALERKPFEIQLRIRKLVVHKRPTQLARFRENPAEHVGGIIQRSLERQLELLGLPNEVPPVRVVDLQGEFVAKLGHGSAAFRGVKEVTFAMPAKLTGLWSMGFMTSNGYGLCDANLGNAALVAQKLEDAQDALGQ